MAKNKKIKYIVVSNNNYTLFVEQIEKYLSEGYELVGGVDTAIDVRNHNAVIFFQALSL